MSDAWEGLTADETREIIALKNKIVGNPHTDRRYCELYDKHDRAISLRAWGSEKVSKAEVLRRYRGG
jgi:hypothetical protein